MEFGEEHGEFYGEAIAEIETHVEDARARLVYALDNAVDLKKVLDIFTRRVQILENVYRGITPVLLFDIPTAYGQQLNQIGNLLGLPREGWDDDLYRIYLRTQSLLILPERRTQANLLLVIRSLMDTDAGTILYSEANPKTYLLDIPATSLADLIVWNTKFLEKCRPITYNVFIKFVPVDPFVFDDDTGTITVTGEGFSDDTDTIDVGGKLAVFIST